MNRPVLEHEVAFVSLEQPGGDTEDLVADLARRHERGGERHGRAAAREAADAERHLGAVTVDHADVLRGQVELLGDDLGERRLDPLPHGGDA